MRHLSTLLIIALSLASCGQAVEASDQIIGVRYITMTVSDIDETVAFYAQGVDYPVVDRRRVPASNWPASVVEDRTGEVDVALVDLPNVFLRLLDFDPHTAERPVVRPVEGPGYTHVCLISETGGGLFGRLRDAGMSMVTTTEKPVDIGGYGMHYLYGLDPNGAMIELEIADKPRRQDPFWAGHYALVTDDLQVMTDFYETLLGYQPRREGSFSNNQRLDEVTGLEGVALSGAWFTVPNIEIELWSYQAPATKAQTAPPMLDEIGYSEVAFEVRDLDTIRRRLECIDRSTAIRYI